MRSTGNRVEKIDAFTSIQSSAGYFILNEEPPVSIKNKNALIIKAKFMNR